MSFSFNGIFGKKLNHIFITFFRKLKSRNNSKGQFYKGQKEKGPLTKGPFKITAFY